MPLISWRQKALTLWWQCSSGNKKDIRLRSARLCVAVKWNSIAFIWTQWLGTSSALLPQSSSPYGQLCPKMSWIGCSSSHLPLCQSLLTHAGWHNVACTTHSHWRVLDLKARLLSWNIGHVQGLWNKLPNIIWDAFANEGCPWTAWFAKLRPNRLGANHSTNNMFTFEDKQSERPTLHQGCETHGFFCWFPVFVRSIEGKKPHDAHFWSK